MPVLLLAVLAVVAVLALFALFQIVGSIVGLLLAVIMAAIVGYVADAVVPGKTPEDDYGFLGAALAGIVGSWLGVALVGQIGPSLFGIPLIPAFVGALIITFVYSLLIGRRGSRR